MRIKHAGQMPTPTNPKHGAGAYHAKQAALAMRAMCNCGEGARTQYVYVTPVPVTVKRRRAILRPA